jgi:hypothetical protein
MQQTIKSIIDDYATLDFVEDNIYYWSPKNREVHYAGNMSSETDIWKLLHEIGHALLDHKRFKLDIELLHLEIAAWEQAKIIAQNYGVQISEDHIQDCLDTYRDWLYRRSICPNCMNTCTQDRASTYVCFNCNNSWQVSTSRTCRTYRKNKIAPILGAI